MQTQVNIFFIMKIVTSKVGSLQNYYSDIDNSL